ncbi:unnamed protein product [Amaranthus hypochondriacus]
MFTATTEAETGVGAPDNLILTVDHDILKLRAEVKPSEDLQLHPHSLTISESVAAPCSSSSRQCGHHLRPRPLYPLLQITEHHAGHPQHSFRETGSEKTHDQMLDDSSYD